MKNKNYMHRLVDSKVERYLKTFDAVCIEGQNGVEKHRLLGFMQKVNI